MNNLKQPTLSGSQSRGTRIEENPLGLDRRTPAVRLVLAVALATFLASGPAQAQTSPSPASEDPYAGAPPASSPPETLDTSPLTLHLKGMLGLGTPYGFAGAEAELAGQVFSLATGVGAGAYGTQVAVMGARLKGRHFFIDVGLGGSGGDFRITVICLSTTCAPNPKRTALWSNVEVGGGLQARAFHLRAFLGAGILNNPGTFEKEEVVLPYLGLSMGFSVPL
jgi:hypothetical protein